MHAQAVCNLQSGTAYAQGQESSLELSCWLHRPSIFLAKHFAPHFTVLGWIHLLGARGTAPHQEAIPVPIPGVSGRCFDTPIRCFDRHGHSRNLQPPHRSRRCRINRHAMPGTRRSHNIYAFFSGMGTHVNAAAGRASNMARGQNI